MSKLDKLKSWFTISDAAKRLSRELSENVSEADLLQLALEGKFTLSVMLSGREPAVEARIVSADEAETITVPDLLHTGKQMSLRRGTPLPDGRYLIADTSIIHIGGVLELPMLLGEVEDVLDEYRRLTDGPPSELVCIDGTALRDTESGRLFVLKKRYKDRKFTALDPLKSEDFYPRARLPDSSQIIVLKENIDKFLALARREQTISRDQMLQEAADQLAAAKRQAGQKTITKRDIARELAISDEWSEMTSDRIQRIIRKTW